MKTDVTYACGDAIFDPDRLATMGMALRQGLYHARNCEQIADA